MPTKREAMIASYVRGGMPQPEAERIVGQILARQAAQEQIEEQRRREETKRVIARQKARVVTAEKVEEAKEEAAAIRKRAAVPIEQAETKLEEMAEKARVSPAAYAEYVAYYEQVYRPSYEVAVEREAKREVEYFQRLRRELPELSEAQIQQLKRRYTYLKGERLSPEDFERLFGLALTGAARIAVAKREEVVALGEPPKIEFVGAPPPRAYEREQKWKERVSEIGLSIEQARRSYELGFAPTPELKKPFSLQLIEAGFEVAGEKTFMEQQARKVKQAGLLGAYVLPSKPEEIIGGVAQVGAVIVAVPEELGMALARLAAPEKMMGYAPPPTPLAIAAVPEYRRRYAVPGILGAAVAVPLEAKAFTAGAAAVKKGALGVVRAPLHIPTIRAVTRAGARESTRLTRFFGVARPTKVVSPMLPVKEVVKQSTAAGKEIVKQIRKYPGPPPALARLPRPVKWMVRQLAKRIKIPPGVRAQITGVPPVRYKEIVKPIRRGFWPGKIVGYRKVRVPIMEEMRRGVPKILEEPRKIITRIRVPRRELLDLRVIKAGRQFDKWFRGGRKAIQEALPEVRRRVAVRVYRRAPWERRVPIEFPTAEPGELVAETVGAAQTWNQSARMFASRSAGRVADTTRGFGRYIRTVTKHGITEKLDIVGPGGISEYKWKLIRGKAPGVKAIAAGQRITPGAPRLPEVPGIAVDPGPAAVSQQIGDALQRAHRHAAVGAAYSGSASEAGIAQMYRGLAEPQLLQLARPAMYVEVGTSQFANLGALAGTAALGAVSVASAQAGMVGQQLKAQQFMSQRAISLMGLKSMEVLESGSRLGATQATGVAQQVAVMQQLQQKLQLRLQAETEVILPPPIIPPMDLREAAMRRRMVPISKKQFERIWPVAEFEKIFIGPKKPRKPKPTKAPSVKSLKESFKLPKFKELKL